MADKSVDEYSKWLSTIGDIADFRDKSETWASTDDRILDLLSSGDDEEFNYKHGEREKIPPTLQQGDKISDRWFSNDPLLNHHKDGKRSVNSSGNLTAQSLFRDSSLGDFSFLEAMGAEMKELSRREDADTISDREKKLLDAYRGYMEKRTGFNKGGMVSDLQKQMSFFSEGGMEAPEVDPVSGNEVPPGSLDEEVRDDVPAMLSEGEYVVPADVLRYFGVKFFEDLRTEAKSSLEGMESDGRMGGEASQGPQGQEEISPEDIAMLEEIMSQEAGAPQQMNKGGMVNPEFTYSGSHQNHLQGMPQFQPRRTFAEGGLSPSSFSPGQWNVGSSYTGGSNASFGNTGNRVTSWRTYKGPNGETMTVQHGPNGPLTPIPPGFEMVKDAVNEQKEKVEKEQQEMPDFGGIADQDPGFDPSEDAQSWAESVAEQVANDPMAVGVDALSGNNGVFGDIAGALGGGVAGGIVGAAMGLNDIAKARGVEAYMNEKGLDTTDINAQINDAVENLGMFGKIGEKMGWADGKKYGESLTQAMTETKDHGVDFSSPLGTSMKSTFSDVQAALGKGSTTSSTPSSTSTSTSETSNTSGSSDSSSGPSAGASSSANEDGAGNMNKGGLVKDTRNKASKTSAKASTPKKGRAKKAVVQKRGSKSTK